MWVCCIWSHATNLQTERKAKAGSVVWPKYVPNWDDRWLPILINMLDNCARALTWTILDAADRCLDSPGHALLAVTLHALRPPAPVKAYRAYRANVPQCNFGTNAAWLCKPTLTRTTRVLGIGDKSSAMTLFYRHCVITSSLTVNILHAHHRARATTSCA